MKLDTEALIGGCEDGTTMSTTDHNSLWLGNQVNNLSLKEAALYYATKGIPVFPLRESSKLPYPGWSWKKTATTDLKLIEDWWTRWPRSNIGIACGEAAGFNALDIDMKDGRDGWRSYQALAHAEYVGPAQRTPTGGYHLFFQYKPGFINFTRRGEFGGIDMRTDGGYIVGAPSVLPTGRYEMVNEGTPGEMLPRVELSCNEFSEGAGETVDELPDLVEPIDYHNIGLNDKVINYLDNGDYSPWLDSTGRPDESAAIFAVSGALQHRLQDAAMTFSIMQSNPHAWACAARHRSFGNPTEWLWKHGIGKMVKAATKMDVSEMFRPINPIDTDLTAQALLEDPQNTKNKLIYPQGNLLVSPTIGFQKIAQPVKWLIKGWYCKGETSILYGNSNAGKTFEALDQCLCIATGRPWRGMPILFSGPVIYVCAEGQESIWTRVAAWCEYQNYLNTTGLPKLTPESLEGQFYITNQAVNIFDYEELNRLAIDIQHLRINPAMVALDTLAANMIGNENDTKDMSQFINIIKKIANSSGAHMLAVHHTGKNEKSYMRGSSAIEGGIDNIFKLEKQESLDDHYIVELIHEKSRDHKKQKPVCFEYKEHILMDYQGPNGEVRSSLVPVPIEKEYQKLTVKKQVKLTNNRAAILDMTLNCLDKNSSLNGQSIGITYDDLKIYAKTVELTKEARHNMKRSLEWLVSNGYIRFQEHNGKVWYMKGKEL